MIAIIAFIIVMFGSLNWLCIGFFQYDLVAGLFGYQGSIFSRIVYIIVGIAAIYVSYSIIKHKGRISVKRLAKEEPIKMNSEKKQDNNKIDNQQVENSTSSENQINNSNENNSTKIDNQNN